jgi:hypothetical protein
VGQALRVASPASLRSVLDEFPPLFVLLVLVVLEGVLVVAVTATAVPLTLRSLEGVGLVLADLALLAAIGVAGTVGPLALRRLSPAITPCVGGAVAFAVLYDASLLVDLAGHPLPLDPYLFFIATASSVAFCSYVRTASFGKAVGAAVWSLVLGTVLWSIGWLAIVDGFWGTRAAHDFWIRDGAISDFRRSGTSNLSVFLIRDIQGALFFHPLLSVALGVIFGTVGALLAVTVRRTATVIRH